MTRCFALAAVCLALLAFERASAATVAVPQADDTLLIAPDGEVGEHTATTPFALAIGPPPLELQPFSGRPEPRQGAAPAPPGSSAPDLSPIPAVLPP